MPLIFPKPIIITPQSLVSGRALFADRGGSATNIIKIRSYTMIPDVTGLKIRFIEASDPPNPSNEQNRSGIMKTRDAIPVFSAVSGDHGVIETTIPGNKLYLEVDTSGVSGDWSIGGHMVLELFETLPT